MPRYSCLVTEQQQQLVASAFFMLVRKGSLLCWQPTHARASNTTWGYLWAHLTYILRLKHDISSGIRGPRLPGSHHPQAQVHCVFYLLRRSISPHRLQRCGEKLAGLNTLYTRDLNQLQISVGYRSSRVIRF